MFLVTFRGLSSLPPHPHPTFNVRLFHSCVSGMCLAPVWLSLISTLRQGSNFRLHLIDSDPQRLYLALITATLLHFIKVICLHQYSLLINYTGLKISSKDSNASDVGKINRKVLKNPFLHHQHLVQTIRETRHELVSWNSCAPREQTFLLCLDWKFKSLMNTIGKVHNMFTYRVSTGKE